MIHVLDVIGKPCNQNLRYTIYVVVEIYASQVGHDAFVECSCDDMQVDFGIYVAVDLFK